MNLIIFLGTIACIHALFRYPPGKVAVLIYIPVMMLVPDAFHANVMGTPNSGMAIMIPLFIATLIAYARFWKPSFADFLVIFIAFLMVVSEFQAVGFEGARNRTFGVLFKIIGPYMVARLTIEREGLHVELAKQIAFMVSIVAVLSIYEFKFGVDQFMELPARFFFPGQGGGWVVTFRYGFARIAGPYAHCILAGMMMIIAYRLSRWLEWGGHWEATFKKFPNLPLSKGKLITGAILLGSVMTLARGPWLGGILAAFFVNAGRSPKRKMAMITAFSCIILIGVPGYIGFKSYTDVKPGQVMTMSQETAIYRQVLFEKYTAIAKDHAWLGWGKNTWPKVPGMSSIDNYYLLLSLMSGIFTTSLFILLMGWLVVRLYMKGMAEPVESNSIAFTLMGIIIAIFVSLATVYLGENVEPVFYFILGWSESYLHGKGASGIAQTSSNGEAPPEVNPQKTFRRVIK